MKIISVMQVTFYKWWPPCCCYVTRKAVEIVCVNVIWKSYAYISVCR